VVLGDVSETYTDLVTTVFSSTIAAKASPSHPGFLSLLQQTAMQALYHLGVVDDGSGMARTPDFEHARSAIAQLESLEAKTKGNLSREEQQALQDTLQDVRMAFVETSRRAEAEAAP